MTAPSAAPPTPSNYVDMLVEGREDGALTALETIREAANAHGDATKAETPTAPHGGELAFRVSTPERIRHKSEVLYGEIQTMLQRHDTRTGREREVQRRESRGSRVAAWDDHRRSSARRDGSPARATATATAATPLPDLHQMFEASRRAHLTEAQQQRTYFPSSSKPTAYSSKDPSTFSYRFQALEPPPTGQ